MSHDMLPLWHPDWEPIWRASDETGVPVHIHTIGPRPDTRFMNEPKHYRPWLATHITAFQIPMMAVCAAVIFGGALERHPNMKVVIGEAGHRLAAVRARALRLRVGGPVPRSDPAPAVGVLAPADVRDVPDRPHRIGEPSSDRRRDGDVGLRLPAPRRHLARLARDPAPAARERLARGPAAKSCSRTPRAFTDSRSAASLPGHENARLARSSECDRCHSSVSRRHDRLLRLVHDAAAASTTGTRPSTTTSG